MSFSVVLFDDCAARERLYPLTSTRPTGNLRVGILTLNQKWHHIFKTDVSYLTKDFLQTKYPLTVSSEEILVINAAVLPTPGLIEELKKLEIGQRLVSDRKDWIAVKLLSLTEFSEEKIASFTEIITVHGNDRLDYPEDIYLKNGRQISFDIACMELQKVPDKLLANNVLRGADIYVDETAVLQGCVLDSSHGPIYIGAGAIVEAGVVIHGPAAIGSGCRIKNGTVIYMNVSLGENCTLCGEINNTVIWGNSAKGHLGYLGCAVLGEGCNLGAGTSNSNLRNDWKSVKLYDYLNREMRDTNLLKCGVIIADHVMLGINSKINTGTVIGVGSQIAISDFIPKFVPDFSWMTDSTDERYIFEHFIEMMKRKAIVKQAQFKKEDELLWAAVYEAQTFLK